MKILRHPRSTRLFAAFALTVLASLSGAPDQASAQTCTFKFARYNYYAEPEKITLVGQCSTNCSGQTSCTGVITSYRTTVYSSACPICS